MNDKHLRSIVKAISWRIIATLITGMIVFVLTGNLTLSIGVSFFELLTKMVVYYFHERIWNRIKWGVQG